MTVAQGLRRTFKNLNVAGDTEIAYELLTAGGRPRCQELVWRAGTTGYYQCPATGQASVRFISSRTGEYITEPMGFCNGHLRDYEDESYDIVQELAQLSLPLEAPESAGEPRERPFVSRVANHSRGDGGFHQRAMLMLTQLQAAGGLVGIVLSQAQLTFGHIPPEIE